VAVSVADLVNYYADAPPPKNDSLADLEARLEALTSPGYRSPFKFATTSLPSIAAGAFGTTKYDTLGRYTSFTNTLKLSTVADIASPFPLHHSALSTKPWAASLSGLITFGDFPCGTGDFFGKTLEKWGIRSLEETAQWWIDALGSAQPAELHPLELAANEALSHLMAGRRKKVEHFLRHWLRIAEPDIETHEAMMRVLSRTFERRLSALKNPAAWLRQAVLRERAGILAERDQADTYSQRLAEERANEEDAYHEPGKTFYLPPKTTYVATPVDKPDPFVRPRNTGMRPLSAEDPYLLVPNKHGSWRQALEELADSGRHPTQERARLTLEYRQELEDREDPFLREKFLRRIGGADAERALKEAARTRHKQILKESA
jgi:hypothetical protein